MNPLPLATTLDPLLVLAVVLPLAVSIAGPIVVLTLIKVSRAGRVMALSAHPPVPLTLVARVLRPGEQFSVSRTLDPSTYGTVTATAGLSYWAPDVGPGWVAPLGAITVTDVHGVEPFREMPSLDVLVDVSGP
jgi:hypothetical protein